MALTRKMLSAFGIEPDKIDEIIEAHAQTVNGLKDRISELEGKGTDSSEKLTAVQKELDDTKKELDALKKAQAKDAPYKEKYEELKGEYDKYKKGIEQKETTEKVTKAYKEVLKSAKIADKYVDVIIKATDMSEFKLDDDGAIEGAKEAAEKAAKEWPEFVTKTTTEGANTNTPPDNNGGKMTKEQIMAIKDRGERQKAISENHELFGY